jgi:hypothetical protein
MSRGMRRDGAFAGIEGEDSTAFFRAQYTALKKAGLTASKSFDAWAKELGIIVASNHGWDDSRRRRVHSIEQIIDSSERSDYRAAGPGSGGEAQMRPISTGGKRRSRRRRRNKPTA